VFFATVTDRSWRARRVALIGGGPRAEFNTDAVRKLAVVAGLSARQHRVERVAFVLPEGGADHAQAAAEGLTLSEFNAGRYKTEDASPAKVPAWTIVFPSESAAARGGEAVMRGRVLGECSNLAREMANEPSNTLTPREFARRCDAVVSEGGAAVEILDEHAIAKLGMGLLLGVARGSSEPPRLMVFRYEPPGAP